MAPERRGNMSDAEQATRVPPHDLEAERSVIGAMLVSESAVSTVTGALEIEDFYSEIHRLIYEAMLNLVSAQVPVDQLTVTDELRRLDQFDEVGGRPYVFRLVESVPTAVNTVHWANLVREKAILREVIDVGTRMVEDAFREPDSANNVLSGAEEAIYEVSNRADASRGLNPLSEVMPRVLQNVQERYETDGAVTGVPSGYHDLDVITGGFQKQDLIVIGARPAMGKTGFMLGTMKNAAESDHMEDKDIACFSLEMSEEDLGERLLSREAKVDLLNMRQGIIEDHQWPILLREMNRLGQMPIHVDDDAAQTVVSLRSKAMRLQKRLESRGRSLGLVAIDYLQLMDADERSDTRQQEVANISRSLKRLAKELDVPVMVLAQLNRALEARQDKRPILSDLRDSGAVEQDADLVLGLYRHDYYHPDDEPDMDADIEERGTCEVLVRKHRNGPLGMARLVWRGDYAALENMARISIGG